MTTSTLGQPTNELISLLLSQNPVNVRGDVPGMPPTTKTDKVHHLAPELTHLQPAFDATLRISAPLARL
eukprot:2887989-Prorocentrum_lima.AAC.1